MWLAPAYAPIPELACFFAFLSIHENCLSLTGFRRQAGWKESHAQFIQELKNIQSSGLTNLGSSLKHCFDLLNINRMQSGIDTYGQVSAGESRWRELILQIDMYSEV